MGTSGRILCTLLQLLHVLGVGLGFFTVRFDLSIVSIRHSYAYAFRPNSTCKKHIPKLHCYSPIPASSVPFPLSDLWFGAPFRIRRCCLGYHGLTLIVSIASFLYSCSTHWYPTPSRRASRESCGGQRGTRGQGGKWDGDRELRGQRRGRTLWVLEYSKTF